MLVGHVAVAFIGKKVEPKLSLGTLVLGSMLPDFLWTIFSITGLEYVMTNPTTAHSGIVDVSLSHSLLTVTIWGALFAAAYFLKRHDVRSAWVLFATVLSHWLLDAISHKHALAPGVSILVGLGLWKSFIATVVVEGGFWLLAIILYARTTHPVNWMGTFAFWPVVAFLTFVWISNIRTGPPPRETLIGSLIFFSLLVAWAYWMNRVRPARQS